MLRWGKVLLANSSCHIQRERLMTTWESLSHTSQESQVTIRPSELGDTWWVTWPLVTRVWRCDAPRWPLISHRLSLSGPWHCWQLSGLHSPSPAQHSASVSSLKLCIHWVLTLATRDTSDSWKWLTLAGEYLAFSWVHQINCHWRSGLKHKQTRIAYQTWHPKPKISH